MYGFDSSRVILAKNRRRATRERRANLHFGYAVLPETPAGTYDLVTCIATLHYLACPELAILALYRMVKKDGHLVFNYPNRLQQAAYRRASRTDPTVATRFALVLSGRNLLTRAKIEGVIGQRAEDLWTAVHEPAIRTNPCVVVAKRRRT